MERVKIFIDGSNFYHGLITNLGTPKINFKKFITLLTTLTTPERRLIHTHYYNTPVSQQDNPEKYQAQQKFFNAIRQIPHLTLHYGRLVKREESVKCPSCNQEYKNQYRIEKGVDVSLATDMLIFAFDNQYDVAKLVSEDGDYTHAIEEVQRMGKRVINVFFPRKDNKPSVLSKKCNNFIPLTSEFLKDCLFN